MRKILWNMFQPAPRGPLKPKSSLRCETGITPLAAFVGPSIDRFQLGQCSVKRPAEARLILDVLPPGLLAPALIGRVKVIAGALVLRPDQAALAYKRPYRARQVAELRPHVRRRVGLGEPPAATQAIPAND